ncbi:MAG: hypothetical protein EXR71_19540 [Myxococcales bacterium]|nr:hypothetical protein [Myxococcales bacterium]
MIGPLAVVFSLQCALGAEASAVDRRVVVAFGAAASWSAGGAAGIWAPASAQRLEVSGEVGRARRTAIGFSLVHARPDLLDAGELVSGVPADAVGGWRDELSILFTLRVPIDVGAALPPEGPGLAVLPCFGVGAGVLASDAHLDVMGFGARAGVRSRSLLPVLAARLGVELRVWNWVSLLPHGELLLTVGPDAAEGGPGEVWDAEARVLAGADVLLRF